jgi:lipoprotein-releasing system permease protein
MPWYLYLALKQLFPTGKWGTFFTVVSVLGVILGVWLLIIITGVMGGFGHKYSRMIIETQGEIQIRGALIPRHDDLQRTLEKIPEVAATMPIIEGIVMAQNGNRITFPSAIGIDTATAEKVIPIEKYLIKGSLPLADLDDDRVILSQGVRAELGIHALGEKVARGPPHLTADKFSTHDATMLFPTDLEVSGVYEFGHQQLDKQLIVLTLRRAQDLFGLDDTVTGINLRLAPGANAMQVAQQINATLPPGSGLLARTWMQSGEAFLFALKIERILVVLIVSAVIFVVAFLVTAMLFVAVARKTRDIGLYGALGATPWQSALCFCFQGIIIGITGTLLGLALGLLTLAYLDPIVKFLAWLTGSWELLEAIYDFANVPTHLTAGNIAIICLYSIGMSTLAGLIAAWRAAKLKPVEAMRSE